jgi:hypothetical protein
MIVAVRAACHATADIDRPPQPIHAARVEVSER